MKLFAFFYLFLSSVSVWAESTVPSGCQVVRVQGQSVSIDTKKSSLIFIHNLSAADLWMIPAKTKEEAEVTSPSRLQEGNWAALTLNQGSFALNCIESRPGHEQQIPCEGAIAVCVWKGKKVKIPEKDQKTVFWPAEDLSLRALIAAVGALGYSLPVSSKG